MAASALVREYTYSDKLVSKGLQNPSGQNNCFLNSAIQVLWHVDVFRRKFRQIRDHACTATGDDRRNCIFCALQVIFTQLQYSDMESVPPDAVRNAMAHTFAKEDRFQTGLMEDATECFERILSRIHYHLNPDIEEDDCAADWCIPHQHFALKIAEQTVCSTCAASSNPLSSIQMVHYVSTVALANGFARGYHRNTDTLPTESFGRLLKRVLNETEPGPCPKSKPRCGRTSRLHRALINSPNVVTLGLVWDSEHPDPDNIAEVMQSIDCSLKLSEMFDTVPDAVARHAPLTLVAIVYYYLKHYSAFLFHAKRKAWVCVDDSYITEVGSDWRTVVETCCKGHYQPLLLVYADHSVGVSEQREPVRGKLPVPDQKPPGGINSNKNQPPNCNTGENMMQLRSGKVTNSYSNKKSCSADLCNNNESLGVCRQPSYLAAVDAGVPCKVYVGGRMPRYSNGMNSSMHCLQSSENQFGGQCAARNQAAVWGDVVSSNDCLKQRTGMQGYGRIGSTPQQQCPAGEIPPKSFSRSMNNLNNLTQWSTTGEEITVANYIDPRLVENVIRCRQMKKGCTDTVIVDRQPTTAAKPGSTGAMYGSHQSLSSGDYPMLPGLPEGEFISKLETEAEADRDSGISGDRNSSSSTSSGISVESSLTSLGSITDLVVGQNPGDRSSSGSTASNLSIDYLTASVARMTQKLRYPDVMSASCSTVELQQNAGQLTTDHYSSLPRRKNAKATPDVRTSYVGPSTNILSTEQKLPLSPDDECNRIIMTAEGHSETSNNFEHLGDLSKAFSICQQAIDVLQKAECISGLSHDMLVHVRMKRNALVLNSRRLQRLMIPKTNITTSTHKTCKTPMPGAHDTNVSRQLSKEEIGEILVREIEGQRLRPMLDRECRVGLDTVLKPPPPGAATVTQPTPVVNIKHRQLTYEEMIRQQVKTFTAREKEMRTNTGAATPVPTTCRNTAASVPLQNIRKQQSDCQRLDRMNCQNNLHASEPPVQFDVVKPQISRTGAAAPQSVQTCTSDLTRPLASRPSSRNANSYPSAYESRTADVLGNIDNSVSKQHDGDKYQQALKERRQSAPNLACSSAVTAINKKKKSVTFSDNIEMVASASDDITEPTNYMTYAIGIQQRRFNNTAAALKPALRSQSSTDSMKAVTNATDSQNGQDSDGSSGLEEDDSEVELDDANADGKVRCSLCQQKWVEPSSTYCPDCSAYMARLQAPA